MAENWSYFLADIENILCPIFSIGRDCSNVLKKRAGSVKLSTGAGGIGQNFFTGVGLKTRLSSMNFINSHLRSHLGLSGYQNSDSTINNVSSL